MCIFEDDKAEITIKNFRCGMPQYNTKHNHITTDVVGKVLTL